MEIYDEPQLDTLPSLVPLKTWRQHKDSDLNECIPTCELSISETITTEHSEQIMSSLWNQNQEQCYAVPTTTTTTTSCRCCGSWSDSTFGFDKVECDDGHDNGIVNYQFYSFLKDDDDNYNRESLGKRSRKNRPLHQHSKKKNTSTNGGGYTNNCLPAQSIKNHQSIIPFHFLPNLPQSDVCEATLKRIHDEFLPIVQRRGYQVRSISELCCCSDGLDFAKNKRTKCRRMGDNVLGYNQTSISGRFTKKSHSIHLRLRRPRQHSSFYPWEDVTGTMAHELAHCVHSSHNDAFFQLMDEILEEHYQLQLYGPNGPSWLRPTNIHNIVGREWSGAAAAAALPSNSNTLQRQSDGQRLGGKSNRNGKSRLIEEFSKSARKLGGGNSTTLTSTEIRQRAAAAAEARQRQLNKVRKIATQHQAKELCIIELLDNDDEEDARGAAPICNRKSNSTDVDDPEPVAAAASKKRHSEKDCIEILNDSDDEEPMESEKPKSVATHAMPKTLATAARNEPVFHSQQESDAGKRRRNQIIDLTKESGPTVTKYPPSWECRRCTFKNRKGAVCCEICTTHL